MPNEISQRKISEACKPERRKDHIPYSHFTSDGIGNESDESISINNVQLRSIQFSVVFFSKLHLFLCTFHPFLPIRLAGALCKALLVIAHSVVGSRRVQTAVCVLGSKPQVSVVVIRGALPFIIVFLK